MSREANELWERATRALTTAERLVSSDADAAASRAYYAAFFAVSAFFSTENRDFAKHSALEAAVHRDLVKSGRWPRERGADFSFVRAARSTGDYGIADHVSAEMARDTVAAARRILQSVHEERPDVFPADLLSPTNN